MITFVDETGSINYCFHAALVSCTVVYSFLVKRYVYTFLLKRYVSHNVHQLLFRTRLFALTKLSMLDYYGSHMHARSIYDLIVVHLFN